MTEFAEKFRNDELDEEDRLLRSALVDLQTTVEGFMRRAGKSVNDLTEYEQQELVDSIDPHLRFELQFSGDIYKSMSIVVSGAGAFLLADHEESLLGAQVTSTGDVITGTVSGVQAYPVPSLEVVLGARSSESIPTYDQSLSAVVILDGAKFYSSPSSDGAFQITHDLGVFRVLIPVVYGMDTRAADVDV